MTTNIAAAGFWTGLCILLLLVLSGLTSAARRKHKVSIGDGGKPEVLAASRAFGNAAEYIPIGVLALALLAFGDFSLWAVHLVGGSFFLGRVLHAWGMFVTREGRPPAIQRMAGMLLTYLPLLASAVTLIWGFFAGMQTYSG